jgi:hypothetical protein
VQSLQVDSRRGMDDKSVPGMDFDGNGAPARAAAELVRERTVPDPDLGFHAPPLRVFMIGSAAGRQSIGCGVPFVPVI